MKDAVARSSLKRSETSLQPDHGSIEILSRKNGEEPSLAAVCAFGQPGR